MVIWQPAPRRILGERGIYIFNAKFKWVILKIKAKMTLLQFLAISPLIMVWFQKFKNRVTADDLLYQFIYTYTDFWCILTLWERKGIDAFLRTGSIRVNTFKVAYFKIYFNGRWWNFSFFVYMIYFFNNYCSCYKVLEYLVGRCLCGIFSLVQDHRRVHKHFMFDAYILK